MVKKQRDLKGFLSRKADGIEINNMGKAREGRDLEGLHLRICGGVSVLEKALARTKLSSSPGYSGRIMG